MAVTIQSADQILKVVYRELLVNQLNTETDPLYNAIETSTEGFSGKKIVVAAPFGVNGGIGAGTETGQLPKSNGNLFQDLESVTKNLYGTITISDKSMKASMSNEGAFVTLLDNEIEGLKRTAKFNLSRMLFGDGVGIIANASGAVTNAITIPVNSYQYLIEGLTIDILDAGTKAAITNGKQRRIMAVLRDDAAPKIIIDTDGGNVTLSGNELITVQQSYNMELTGLKAIFQNTGSLYGVDRTANYWMVPYMQGSIGAIADVKIQKSIDYLKNIAGAIVNFILCSSGVKRGYQSYMEQTKRNVNTLDLQGGFSALSYNGKPLVDSQFAPAGTMKLLDTTKFTLYHMGDWDWLQGTMGNILNQIAGTPVWTASLVRYCELMCKHPGGQAELSGITES